RGHPAADPDRRTLFGDGRSAVERDHRSQRWRHPHQDVRTGWAAPAQEPRRQAERPGPVSAATRRRYPQDRQAATGLRYSLRGSERRPYRNRRPAAEVPLMGRSGLVQSAGFKKELDQTIAASGDTVPPWKIHWLRHSFTTHLNEMGIDQRVIEAITNHLGPQISAMAARYTHTKYPDEQRGVLKAWAQRIRNAADRVEVAAANVAQFQLKEQTSHDRSNRHCNSQASHPPAR